MIFTYSVLMDNANKPIGTIDEELIAHLPKMKAQALYFTRSDQKADDLVQSTCLRAWSRRDQYEPGTKFGRWVSTIMQSIWFSDLRQQRARQEEELPEPDLESVATFERDIQNQLFVSDIRRTCTKLNVEDFSLLIDLYVHGFTYKEISVQNQEPIGTILSRASRAKMMIRDALKQLDQEAGE